MHSGQQGQLRQLALGGLAPVLLFTVIEMYYGTLAGLVCGMIFGAAEIAYEYFRYKKVSAITLGANALILVLGAVSLISTEGLWFKLQPAIMEAIFAILLIGSVALKKPFLVLMANKQNIWKNVQADARPFLEKRFSGLTLRLGFFFLIHAIIATCAAFCWPTAAWALLKGVGFTVSFLIYMLIEVLVLRRQPRKETIPR